MRRLRTGLIATGYALSFLVVCLGACLAPAAGGDHACCPDGEGLRAPAVDCCSVVPGVAQAPALSIDGPPALIASPVAAPAAARLVARGPAAAVTPSPPLVLRI